jgi:hypothetical protein
VKNPGSRNLRRDQDCRDDRRQADQPQELIRRKHGCPQRVQNGRLSKTGVQLVRCADGWPLVRIRSDTTAPEIVSSARTEMTANVLMA